MDDDPQYAAAKKEMEREALSQNAFEALERDFQEVLAELVGDKSLERFRVEYEKLHRALKKAHESEKRLMKKCRDLNQEIVSNAAKVQTALKFNQEDQNTINSLKKEIEKAWKMVDASHEKESRAKETIQQLKVEIANLSKLVEQGAGLTVGQEHSVNELLKVKEELTKERDRQLSQIVALRSEVSESQDKARAQEDNAQRLESELNELKDTVSTMKADGDRAQRRKERLEKELKEHKAILESRQAEVKSKQHAVQQGHDQIARLENQVREQKAITDRAAKEYDQLSQRLTKLQHDLEEQVQTNTTLLAENTHRQVELKVKEDEVATIKQDLIRVNRVRDGLVKKIKSSEDQKLEIEKEKDRYRGQMAALQREVESFKRQAETDAKTIDDLLRARDLLNKNLLKAAGSTQKQSDLVKINENTKRHLEAEVSSYKHEVDKQRKLITQLEKEREKYNGEAADANQKYLHALEEVKVREMQVLDLNKKIAEAETKLKQQQNLYEQVRSDRNLYSKNLIESQDEISEMKRKFKILNHQIEQLKEEISAKDHALVKEHFDHMKVEKEKESLRAEVTRIKQQINMADQTVKSQQAEVHKLNHIINEADSERVRQKKEYDTVINERDILGTQLIRRNDELALLYEKIKIQQSILSKGSVQYRERMEDIRLLKNKINDLKREIHVIKSSATHVDNLKNEVYHLQRELLQERTKVKALSEELENPMNIHRWRKLEGSDPATYELIQKIQTLQKRLIAKTEEVVEKDLQIVEKEKVYMEVKAMLARQPGPEVAEQVNVYKSQLKEKTKQLKAMASELNMYQAQVAEYKFEIERVERDLDSLKRKYYAQRRKEQIRKDRDAAEKGSGEIVPTAPAGPRYAGGGFLLNQSSRDRSAEI